MEGAGFSRSKSASLGSIERSDVGMARTSGNLLDLDQRNQVGPDGPTGLQSMETQISHRSLQCSVTTTNLKKEWNSEKRGSTMPAIPPQLHTSNGFQLQSKSFSGQESAFILSELSDKGDGFISGLSSLDSNSMSVGRADTKGALSSSNSLGSEVSNTSGSNPFDLGPSIQAETEHGDSHNSLDFAQCFHEGYCKISELDDCRELAEVVNDADSSSSHCEREKPEGDGDNDDMLGGVFAFCEEG